MKRLIGAALALALAGCQPPPVTPASTPLAPQPGQAPGETPASPSTPQEPSGTPQTPGAQPQTPGAASGGVGDPSGVSLALGQADQLADTWRPGPPLQQPRAGLAAGVLAGAVIAAEGGPGGSFEALVNGRWTLSDAHDLNRHPTSQVAFQTNSRYLAAAAQTERGLLLAGGHHMSFPVTLYAAEGVGPIEGVGFGSEATVSNPTRSVSAAVAGVIDATLIVVGGASTGPLGAAPAEAPDAPTDWTQLLPLRDGNGAPRQLAPMPQPRAGACGLVIGRQLWVFGGYEVVLGKATPTDTVQVYDYDSDSWASSEDTENAPPALLDACHSAAAAMLGGKVYVVGGVVDRFGSVSGRVQIYDPASRRWSRGAAMPTPRALLGLAANEGRLWALGGRDHTGQALRTVEVYRP